MTTTSTTSANSTAASASAQSIISSMGLGSGVDVQALAKNLVNAVQAPQQDAINKKISKSEAKISGYGAISYILSDLKSKFAALNSTSGFNAVSVSNSQSSSFTATVSGSASNGNHSVTVKQLAQGQRSMSATGYSSPDAVLPATALDITLPSGTYTASVNAGSTIRELVNAINSEMGSAGIKAQLVNRGAAANPASEPYYLVISGPSGQSNSFSASGLDLSTTLQSAQNAKLEVDNIEVQSESNTVTGAITGVSLNLTAVSPSSGVDGNNQPVYTPANLSFTRDNDAIQTKIKALVTSFNDVNSVLSAAADPKSEVENYGASLVGDSTVSLLRNQIRAMLFDNSSTPSTGSRIQGLRDLGVSLDSTGSMTLDEGKLSSALNNHFDEVVQMMSASRETPTLLRSLPSGLAGDAVKQLDDMLMSNAMLATQSKNAQSQITRYQSDLEKLDTRMSMLLARYNQQFAAMENLLTQTNGLKTSLKSSFEGMMASYNNN